MPSPRRTLSVAALTFAVGTAALLAAGPASAGIPAGHSSSAQSAPQSAAFAAPVVTLSLRDLGAIATWTVPADTAPNPIWWWWLEYNGTQIRSGHTTYNNSNLGGVGPALVAEETYQVHVAQLLDWNAGDPILGPAGSAELVARGKAAAPTNVVSVAGNKSVTVTWDAPPAERDVTIGLYMVRDPATGLFVHLGPDARSHRFTSLDNGRKYTFEVTAEHAFGWGETAAGNTVIPAGAPGRPSTVRAQARNNAARITWRAADANGSAVTGYRVVATPGGRTVTVGPTKRAAVVKKLRQGRVYRFKVIAFNRVGTSLAASSSRIRPY